MPSLLQKKLQEEQSLEEYALRVGIQGGGCSGLSYTLGFDSEVKEKDKIFDIEGIKKMLLKLDYIKEELHA